MTCYNLHGANRTHLRCALLLLILTVVLSACGRSGGSSDDNPNACGVQNCSPYAVISPPTLTAYAGQLIDLDGSRSTPSTTLTYQWQQTEGDPVVLSNSNEPVAHFLVPTVTSEKKLIFRLIVSNGNSDSFAEIGITIKPLTVSAQASTPTAIVGVPVLLKALVSDDNESLQYLWEQVDSGETPLGIDNATSADASFTTRIIPNASKATFRVTVTNKYGASAEDTVSVNLEAGIIPSITAIRPSHLMAGEELKISGSGFSNAFAVTLTNNTSHAEATFEVKSDHEIRMIVPATSSGDYALTIQNSGGNAQGDLTIGEPLTDVVQVAAGSYSSCALMFAKTVKCWGDGSSGQLGNGAASNSLKPVSVITSDGGPLGNVASISGGALHFCALTEDGGVSCWGINNLGQLGDGTKVDRNSAKKVNLPNKASSISLGANHSCALLVTGEAFCWGAYSANWADLDPNRIDIGTNPKAVVNMSPYTRIVSGGGHTCGILSNDRSVQCWGVNNYGQLGNGTKLSSSRPVDVLAKGSTKLTTALDIALGSNHTCAILADHTATCWGSNTNGQLGTGHNQNQSYPSQVKNNAAGIALAGVIDIDAGRGYQWGGNKANHTCAVLNNNEVVCWGENNKGQLGNRSTADSNLPVTVDGLTHATTLALGSSHSCALTSSGQIHCWGNNNADQLGWRGSNLGARPAVVEDLFDVTAITMGGLGQQEAGFGCALHKTGTISCWGHNDRGQLGNTSTTDNSGPTPVGGISNATSISSGTFHSCAISRGDVFCWGANDSGQLGRSSTTIPVDLPETATEVSAGGTHTCALLSTGKVYCWGNNGLGQLGNASLSNSDTPVEVVNLPESAKMIVTGALHSCAVLEKGEMYCWGANAYGQLGNGTQMNSTIPTYVPIPTNSSIVAAAAGSGHSCATTTGGTVYCWGYNGSGEVGGETTFSSRALLQTNIQDVTATSAGGVLFWTAGEGFNCALQNNNKVKCWGDNSNMQLGADKDTAIKSFEIENLFDIQGISTAGLHTCALYTDGQVSCWGGADQMPLGQAPFGARAVLQ